MLQPCRKTESVDKKLITLENRTQREDHQTMCYRIYFEYIFTIQIIFIFFFFCLIPNFMLNSDFSSWVISYKFLYIIGDSGGFII